MWVLGPIAHIYSIFEVTFSWKLEESDSFWIFKFFLAQSPNTWNESVHIIKMRRMNLFIYEEWIWRYTENTRNEINLQTDISCAYLLNMWKESAHILIKCRSNLDCMKSRILFKFKAKIINIMGLSGPQMGFFWPNHFEPKNLMQVYL
jgi:hypothetical protein